MDDSAPADEVAMDGIACIRRSIAKAAMACMGTNTTKTIAISFLNMNKW